MGILIGILLFVIMVGCVGEETKEQVGEETKEQVAEETKEQVAILKTIEQVVIPETEEAEIGEEVVFTNRYGDFTFKVDNVYLTKYRNHSANPVNHVVIIEYSVTNKDIPAKEFSFDLEDNMYIKFYDVNGFECKTYFITAVDTSGVHHISPNRSGSSAVAIGITCDKPYLEMELGDVLYKFSL